VSQLTNLIPSQSQ